MGAIRDAAIAETRKATAVRRELLVPEWGVTVYARGFVSVADGQAYREKAKRTNGAGEETIDGQLAWIHKIISKIEAEDGSPAFTESDVDFLLREVPQTVILKLSTLADGEETVIPKNLIPTVA